jgi:uncharacterized protein involved in outer membrane biogenesis
MNRLLKWLGIALAALLILVAGLAALLYAAVDEERIRARVSEIALREFGADLRIDGELALTVLPVPTLTVPGIRLRAGEATDDLATVERIRLGVRVAPLFRGELRFDEASVEGLVVQAVRGADGSTNWALAAPAAATTTPAGAGESAAAAGASSLQVAVDRLRLERGALALEDRGAGSMQRLEIDTLTADGFNLQNTPFAVNAQGRFVSGAADKAETTTITLDGRVAADRAAGRVALAEARLQLQPASGEALALEAGEITAERNGALGLHRATMRKGALALENIEARARIEPGLTVLDSLTASLHGGTLDANARLESRDGGRLAADAKLAGTDLAALLQTLGQPPRAQGLLDAALNLQASGSDPEQWKKSLAGPVSISLRDPVLREVNVEELVCKAAATLNKEALSTQFPPETRLDGLETALDFRNGVGEFRTLAATLPSMALAGSGNIDLPQRRLKVHVDARLTRDPGELDPACRMTRKMLALEWPITCRGSFDQSPKEWCGVDSDDLAKLASQLATQKLGDKIKDKLRSFFGNDDD